VRSQVSLLLLLYVGLLSCPISAYSGICHRTGFDVALLAVTAAAAGLIAGVDGV
jgi:hypothetical protein